jgi:hypothetical protein
MKLVIWFTMCQVMLDAKRPALPIIHPENESVISGLVSVNRLFGRPGNREAGVEQVLSI